MIANNVQILNKEVDFLFTSDDEIPVRPDWIVTIVEPVKTIKEMYEEKVNGTKREVSSIED